MAACQEAAMPLALGPIGQIARGVTFDDKPHLIARMDDHGLWMTFFRDPDGHILSLMQEAPKRLPAACALDSSFG
jgi:hypothetical protein